MLWNLLTASASTSSDGLDNGGPDWLTYVAVGVMVVLLIVFMVYSKRQQNKRQEELTQTLNAIKPGNKVKTIGGICGVVVEICPEDNTFVLETGTEASGKSYIKFDKQAVYQTDAVAEKKEETPAAETAPVEEAPAVEETPVAEETVETVETTEDKE